MKQLRLYGRIDESVYTVNPEMWFRTILRQQHLIDAPDITAIRNPYKRPGAGKVSDARTFLSGWIHEVHAANVLRASGAFGSVSVPMFQVSGWNVERVAFCSPDVICDGLTFEVKPHVYRDGWYRVIKANKLQLEHDWLVIVRADGDLRFIPFDALGEGVRCVWDGDVSGNGEQSWVYFDGSQLAEHALTLNQFIAMLSDRTLFG